ncbi:DUF3383 domain-containing protein [Pseudomonas agarici]|uniref:DUF3383 domain-containing protein n=1 Tax=Pseudomonas agarici TaxID=46677 RepID=UPI0002FF1DF1|nr:DUF3383 domain-containing protein [Pseudomonas agarici]NWC11936.1 DUF3383 domain-containing protein [Pseudomonas agarici]SEL85624.1 Protein of unknown function [Pseudomonas agarici]
MTIPVSQIVQVNPGVLAAAGAAVDLNGLILTQSTYAPVGTVPGFALPDDVAAYFGGASVEKALADIYFSGYENSTKNPGLLYFAQYPVAPVAAYLRSGSLASMSLEQLKALTGSLNVTADGVVKTAASIDLSTATSFSSAAAIIATALALPVTYDAIKSAFVITSSTSGAASTISFASGTIAAGLLLTSATGAVTSQGAIASVQGQFMDALIQVTQNWAGFTTAWEPVTADKILFSAWTNSKGDRYVYAGWDSDINAKAAGNTTTWGYYLQSTKSSGSIPIFGDATHAVFALSYMACLDFDRLNGRATLAFRSQSGLSASVTNATDSSSLITNGYNFYGAYATAKDGYVFMYPGSVSGKWLWADSYANEIWLNANLQKAMISLLQAIGSIPYSADGYALVEAACADPLNAAVNFGAIRIGTTLSAAQIAEIQNAVGSDVSGTIIAKGYYLQIVPATAAIRSARTSPSMTLYYADGGSIQKLTLASIEIQ